jgi:hypothetical protein
VIVFVLFLVEDVGILLRKKRKALQQLRLALGLMKITTTVWEFL